MRDIKGDTRSLDYSSYRENGKENGNYCIIIGYILGLYGWLSKLCMPVV